MKRKVKPKGKKKTVTKTVTTTVTTTTTTTGHLKNRIGIIIDSSGSMASMHQEVVNAFNGQVDVIKKNNQDMDTEVSLVTFADNVSPDLMGASVAALQKMEPGDFVPNGSTALYDAIGYMIEYFQALPEAKDENCSFLLVIVTDGQENASQKYKYPRIREMIQSMERTKRWTFTYLGANEGLQDVGRNLGINVGNTMTGQSLRSAGVYAAVATNSMKHFMKERSIGTSSVSNFYSPNDSTGGQGGAGGTNVTTTTGTVPKDKTSNG
jgi:Mg-chelatase subunit ChlD